MDLKMSAKSTIKTARAERLAKQFISHWGRHTQPEQDGAGVIMRFDAAEDWPATAVRVETTPSQILLTAWADDRESLVANCESIADHLHRFAGKQETLTIEWTSGSGDE